MPSRGMKKGGEQQDLLNPELPPARTLAYLATLGLTEQRTGIAL